jgi:hypothetical protein
MSLRQMQSTGSSMSQEMVEDRLSMCSGVHCR